MKIKQLFEVKYAGEHPVIKEITDAFKQEFFRGFGDFRTKLWDLETKDVKRIVKSLTGMFGEPRVGDVRNPEGNVYHWELVVKKKRYGITIGYDSEADTLYGIEIYYVGEPRKGQQLNLRR